MRSAFTLEDDGERDETASISGRKMWEGIARDQVFQMKDSGQFLSRNKLFSGIILSFFNPTETMVSVTVVWDKSSRPVDTLGRDLLQENCSI